MKKLVLFAVALFAVFTLSACVEDIVEDDPIEVPGVTDTAVKVGNTAATSGTFGAVGLGFNAGLEAYFGMINEDGGVNGRQIEFVHYDDEFVAAKGQTYTQTLVEDDEVFALVGHFGTGTVAMTLDYLTEIGIPTVYYATGYSALYNPDAEGTEKGSFPVQPVYTTEGEVMIARAVGDLEAQSVGIIYTTDDAGMGWKAGAENYANANGITLAIASVSASSDDMSTAAQQMIAANVDVIIVAANQGPATTIVLALETAGNTAPVITSYVNAAATWLTPVSSALDSFDIYASAWIDVFDSEGNLSEDYNLFATTIDPAYVSNAFAFAGWIAAATFVEGLERVGTEELTWDSFIAAMEESPVELPFDVTIDYADGNRVGTESMAFLKGAVADGVAAFVTIEPIESIEEILGQ